MTHFRFRYKQVGYMRWRCRTSSRRAVLLFLPLAPVRQRHPLSVALWRRTMSAVPKLAPATKVLQFGDFVIGEEGDPQLMGHPDIRY